MKAVLAAGLAVAIGVAGPGTSWLGPVAAQAAEAGARRRSMAFADADIALVAEDVLGRELRRKFAVSPDVRGTMTFQIDGLVSDAQLLAAFESALALSGAVIVWEDGQALIVPRERARAAAPRVNDSAAAAYRPGYTIRAVVLSYGSASELGKLVQSVYGDGLVAHADDRLGILVLSGPSRDLNAVGSLIATFDRDPFARASFHVQPLRNSEPDIVAAEAERALRAQTQAGVTLIPVSRLRSIVVVARGPELRDMALHLIAQLDRSNPDGASQLHVYRPLYSSAQDLYDAVNQLYGFGQGPSASAATAPPPVAPPGGAAATASPVGASPSPGGGLADADMRIAVDKRTDTLLVWARPTRWTELEDLLQKIDLPPDQVLIEATVLEVTLGDEFRFGVDVSYVTGNDTRILNTGSNTGAVAPQVPGFSIFYVNGDLRAAVSTLAAKTNTKVVSAPKLVVLEGQTANLQVGDQVPVSTQSSQSASTPDAPILVSTEYRDTGIILKVTPRVRGGGRVEIDMQQEVSSVARNTTSGIDSPTIQQRRFDSKLMVEDGQVIALGGLISETSGRTRSGLPGLSDIPLIGGIFGQQSNDVRRTELIILIKPTVLKGEASRTIAVDEILQQMGGLRGDAAVSRVLGRP
jgi:general secretion pathway protein D